MVGVSTVEPPLMDIPNKGHLYTKDKHSGTNLPYIQFYRYAVSELQTPLSPRQRTHQTTINSTKLPLLTDRVCLMMGVMVSAPAHWTKAKKSVNKIIVITILVTLNKSVSSASSFNFCTNKVDL